MTEIRGTDISKIQMDIVSRVDSGGGSLAEVLKDTTLPDLSDSDAAKVITNLVEFFVNRRR